MRKLLIRLLLRLLTPLSKDTPINKENVQKWLWSSYTRPCFSGYIHKRDMAIFQEMGSGVSEKKYDTLIGQRIELGRFLSEAKDAWEKEEAKRKKKLNK